MGWVVVMTSGSGAGGSQSKGVIPALVIESGEWQLATVLSVKQFHSFSDTLEILADTFGCDLMMIGNVNDYDQERLSSQPIWPAP
jgi:hypothetical protein